MDILSYFSDNHANLLFLIAGIAFVLELTVLGLSGLLLFFAIGTFLTGLLSFTGIISGWESEVFSVGLLSGLSALLLWKPFKRFQSRKIPVDQSSDLIGRQVQCVEAINHVAGKVRHSGIDWLARLSSSENSDLIDEGELCVIEKIEGTVLFVAKVRL